MESAIVNVAYDADDLPGRFFKLRSNPLTDDELLPQGIFFGPNIFLPCSR